MLNSSKRQDLNCRDIVEMCSYICLSFCLENIYTAYLKSSNSSYLSYFSLSNWVVTVQEAWVPPFELMEHSVTYAVIKWPNYTVPIGILCIQCGPKKIPTKKQIKGPYAKQNSVGFKKKKKKKKGPMFASMESVHNVVKSFVFIGSYRVQLYYLFAAHKKFKWSER